MIFIAPESLTILEERLKNRGDDSKDITKRIDMAKSEMQAASGFDYQVINFDGQLDQAIDETLQIIQQEL